MAARLTLIYLCSVVLYIGCLEKVNSKAAQADNNSLPKITLERYKNKTSNKWATFQGESSFPDFVIKDIDTLSVSGNKSTATHILLVCRASYPVYWNSTEVWPADLDEISTGFKALFNANKPKFVNSTQPYEFISYLELYNDESFTGLYTCRSVESDNLNSSIYVFLAGTTESPKLLLQAGQHINVGLNGKHSVVLPCKVSQPSAVVHLAKKNENGTWILLKNATTSFDPKRGFNLAIDDLSTMAGQYKCFVDAQELVVNVLHAFREENVQFPVETNTSGVAKWGRYKSKDNVECCSNSITPPNMMVVICLNSPECDMKKRALMHLMPNVSSSFEQTSSENSQGKRCVFTRRRKFIWPFLMQCNGDGVNISGEFVSQFLTPSNRKMNYVTANSPIQNISYNVGTAVKIDFWAWKNKTIRYTRGSFKSMDLNKTGLYSGDKFVADCCGLHYYHATGRIQHVVWKNGSVTTSKTPEDDDTEKRPYVKDYCYTYHYDSDDDSYLLTAHENMSYFECIVPRWYSKEPAVKRVQLNVQESTEPVIHKPEGNMAINLTYNQNQLGLLQLECTLLEGGPHPKVVWKKDGYKVNQTDVNWSVVDDDAEIPGKNLLFMRATREIEGEYECIATNRMGFDVKVFRVKVTPRSYLDYWTALFIFGGFFALIICCAVRITKLEKHVAGRKQAELEFTSDTSDT